MKKHQLKSAIAIAAIVCGLHTQSKAQTDWHITGNNSTNPNTNFIGTINSRDLVFKTNSVERLRIFTGAGGIRIANPADGNILYSTKTGFGDGIYISLTNANNNSSGIYADNQGLGTGLYGYSSRGIGTRGGSVSGTGVYGTTSTGWAISGTASSTGIGVQGIGRLGVAGYSSLASGIGVYGNSAEYIGVQGMSTKYLGVYGEGLVLGVQGNCGNGVGVWGTSIDGYGLQANSQTDNGLVSTTANGNAYAGYFNGAVFSNGGYQSSDAKLKKNVKDVDKGLSIINQLQPKNYEYREDGNYAKMNLPKGNHFGLIAQDVEKVLPQLVKQTKFNTAMCDTAAKASHEEIDFKAVNYTELIPVMIKAIQELSKQNETLQQQLNDMKGSSSSSLMSNKAVVVSDATVEQNTPNPFTRTTSIAYTLPQKYNNAQIVIHNNNGKTVKQVNLSGYGKGNVTIDASMLSSGTYHYSLLVDGKVIAGKQMLLNK